MMKEKTVNVFRNRIIVSLLVLILVLVPFFSIYKFPIGGIDIKTDVDFKKYRCLGEGTAEDPYRIENKKIRIQGSDFPISIRRTTKHFIVRNCVFEGRHGIKIGYIKEYTAKIINCSFIGDNSLWSSALDIKEAHGTVFTNNTISSFYGIGNIIRSSHLFFSNNHMKNNNFRLYIAAEEDGTGYHNITIENNIFENTQWVGLYIDNVEEIYIRNNQFLNSSIGFDEYDFAYNELYNSVVMEDNYVDNKPIGFFKDLTYVEILEEYSQIFVFECQFVNISNQNIKNVYSSIIASKCGNITITNSFIDHSYNSYGRDGSFYYQCQNVVYLNVTLVHGEYSFYSLGIANIHIENCLFYNQTRYCIYLGWNEIGLIINNLFMFNSSIEMIKDLGSYVLVENNTIITY